MSLGQTSLQCGAVSSPDHRASHRTLLQLLPSAFHSFTLVIPFLQIQFLHLWKCSTFLEEFWCHCCDKMRLVDLVLGNALLYNMPTRASLKTCLIMLMRCVCNSIVALFAYFSCGSFEERLVLCHRSCTPYSFQPSSILTQVSCCCPWSNTILINELVVGAAAMFRRRKKKAYPKMFSLGKKKRVHCKSVEIIAVYQQCGDSNRKLKRHNELFRISTLLR